MFQEEGEQTDQIVEEVCCLVEDTKWLHKFRNESTPTIAIFFHLFCDHDFS